MGRSAVISEKPDSQNYFQKLFSQIILKQWVDHFYSWVFLLEKFKTFSYENYDFVGSFFNYDVPWVFLIEQILMYWTKEYPMQLLLNKLEMFYKISLFLWKITKFWEIAICFLFLKIYFVAYIKDRRINFFNLSQPLNFKSLSCLDTFKLFTFCHDRPLWVHDMKYFLHFIWIKTFINSDTRLSNNLKLLFS